MCCGTFGFESDKFGRRVVGGNGAKRLKAGAPLRVEGRGSRPPGARAGSPPSSPEKWRWFPCLALERATRPLGGFRLPC